MLWLEPLYQRDEGSDCRAVEGRELLHIPFPQGSSCVASRARKCLGYAVGEIFLSKIHTDPKRSLDNFPFLVWDKYPAAINPTCNKAAFLVPRNCHPAVWEQPPVLMEHKPRPS